MYMNIVWAAIALVAGIVFIAVRMQQHDYNKTTNIVGYLLILLAVILAISSFIRVVPAGTVGVVDLFGQVSDRARQPGLNFVIPFAKLEIMNVKTEEEKEEMTVPSKEGLSISLEISILHRLSPDNAPTIYKTVGVDYRNVIIAPQFRSVCRGVTVNFEAKSLYTSGREEMSQKIHDELKGMLEQNGIILDKVLLRAIKLPDTVSKAIEVKLKAEQEAEQMKFVLEKETKEAERKVIEAGGIARAQEIINKTLTAAYLQHEAIQSQFKMAESPNHTTVYIPVGTNGLPMVKLVDN